MTHAADRNHAKMPRYGRRRQVCSKRVRQRTESSVVAVGRYGCQGSQQNGYRIDGTGSDHRTRRHRCFLWPAQDTAAALVEEVAVAIDVLVSRMGKPTASGPWPTTFDVLWSCRVAVATSAVFEIRATEDAAVAATASTEPGPLTECHAD